MYDKVVNVYKKAGETPLDCINNLKKDNPSLLNLPLTYAGRLDPLAEGVLVILVGDECLKKDEYLALSKEYELTVLFGFATDTFDLMGKVVDTDSTSSEELFERSSDLLAEFNGKLGQTISNSSSDFVERVNEKLQNFIGRINQKYPPYSSRTVGGKPLYQWARSGKIDEIQIPSHDVYVENIDIMKSDSITGEQLHKIIKENISKVSGDFRQEEILDLWKEILSDKFDKNFTTLTLKVSCGSGVYVRAIANDLGKSLGIPALAMKIIRTKVGDYTINKE